MTVAIPELQWPANLLEEGPPEDPSILLRGEAAIGGTRFSVTAVRMDPIRFGPDFRADQDSAVYTKFQLRSLIDTFADLVEASEVPTLQLRSGRYFLWMLPRSAEA